MTSISSLSEDSGNESVSAYAINSFFKTTKSSSFVNSSAWHLLKNKYHIVDLKAFLAICECRSHNDKSSSKNASYFKSIFPNPVSSAPFLCSSPINPIASIQYLIDLTILVPTPSWSVPSFPVKTFAFLLTP